VSDNIIDRLAVMAIGGTNQWERVLAFDARKEIARLREERRWISVGERLPEIDVPVLVRQQGCEYHAIGWREHRPYYIVPETIWTLGDELDKGYPPEKITHWMPLPPGPEGDGNG
jgi:hypothetical protein